MTPNNLRPCGIASMLAITATAWAQAPVDFSSRCLEARGVTGHTECAVGMCAAHSSADVFDQLHPWRGGYRAVIAGDQHEPRHASGRVGMGAMTLHVVGGLPLEGPAWVVDDRTSRFTGRT